MVDIFWSVVELFDDLNDVVFVWNILFIDVVNCYVFIKKFRVKCVIKFWIIKELKELMVDRDYVFKVVKRLGNE